MSTAPVAAQTLTPKDLRGWPDSVSTALLTMVNRRGVRAKVLDGNHVWLMAPDGEGTLKVSRSRKAEDTLKYLGKFCDDHLPPVIRDDRPAKAAELAPLLKLNTKATREAEAEALAEAAKAHANATWRPYMGYNGKTRTMFDTNGKGVFRCVVKGCGEIFEPGADAKRVLGPHASVHRRQLNTGKGAITQHVPIVPEATVMRAASGKPWRVVGASMGLTDSAVRRWIARGVMPEDRALRLAQVLGVTLGQLTGTEPWQAPAVIPEPRRTGRPPKAAKASQAAQAAPETPVEAEAGPVPIGVATGTARGTLARIAALAHQALGEPDLAAELTQVRAERDQARAEVAELTVKLDDANAKLDLMREALSVVDAK